MKKLMFAAALATVGAAAFADPLVYDYKASTKQMNLKEVKVNFGGLIGKIDVYVKYQTTASLKGYLIVDADGATSTAIQTLVGSGNSVPATCPWDYGRNRAFLVVQNSKAEKDVRFPKIIPAVLDAKWLQSKVGATSGIAEGYLYAGGEFKAGQVREGLDLYNNVMVAPTRTANAAAGFIQDYCWTSIYLFGAHNCPLKLITPNWDNAETAIDGAQDLPQPYTAGATFFFHDSWMNGAGIGKWTKGKNKKVCCGGDKVSAKTLDTLAGNLKGGLFLCTLPATASELGYAEVEKWEDQFFTVRDDAWAVATWAAAGDIDQPDLWQDGFIELNTRDVVTGTWSIKFNQKLKTVAVTNAEIDNLNGGAGLYTEDAKGLRNLMNTIKGAAVALNSKVIFASGDEIWTEELNGVDQVTFLTPMFAAYYGLLNWK